MRVQRAGDVVARREEHRAERGIQQPKRPQVLGPVALGGEQHAAGDDRQRADRERRAQGLVEEAERDRHGDQRCPADDN